MFGIGASVAKKACEDCLACAPKCDYGTKDFLGEGGGGFGVYP